MQVLIALGLLSILVATVAVSALSGITRVRGSAREAITIDGRLSQLASEIATQTLESRRYEKDFYLNVADPHERSNYLAKWQTATTLIDQDIAAFAATATVPEDQQQAAIWRAQLAQYEAHFRHVAEIVDHGEITTPQAANTAFTPFKETIRILTESSVAVADHKATMALATSVSLDAIGARTTGMIGLLATLAIMMTVAYGATDMIALRSQCSDCDSRLPFHHWFGGEHYCRQCELRRLARLIDDAEERNPSE